MSDTPRLIVTRGAQAFAEGRLRETGGEASITIGEEPIGPPLEGFGGCFNEKGWEALGLLSPADRARVISDLFSPEGPLRLSVCRLPIGSSDYALSRYSYAEREGDWDMASFSIERDRRSLIPYAKAAQAANPRLRFWGSAWSPPPWLKDNGAFDSGAMRDDPRAYAAYALYLCRYAEAYRAEGIPVEIVAVQNEPMHQTAYPSCAWSPEQYRIFIRDYLGPLLSKRGSGAGVMLGTLPQPVCAPYAEAVLSDEEARRYVKVLGLQWTGLPVAEEARELAPSLPLWQTETDCGNHHWEKGFDPERPESDFGYANLVWSHMRDFLSAGAVVYELWNMVLDEEGKSIDSKRPWPQNAPVAVDRGAGTARHTPMFNAVAHFSRYAVPGSRLLPSTASPDAIAFRLPDGGTAVVLRNPSAFGRGLRLGLGGRTLEARLPGRSFATLIA